MIVGIPRETFPGARQVAVIPDAVVGLTKAGLEVLVETGAGEQAGYPDQAYLDKGAKLASDREDVFSKAHILLQVQGFGAIPGSSDADLESLRNNQTIIAFL